MRNDNELLAHAKATTRPPTRRLKQRPHPEVAKTRKALAHIHNTRSHRLALVTSG